MNFTIRSVTRFNGIVGKLPLIREYVRRDTQERRNMWCWKTAAPTHPSPFYRYPDTFRILLVINGSLLKREESEFSDSRIHPTLTSASAKLRIGEKSAYKSISSKSEYVYLDQTDGEPAYCLLNATEMPPNSRKICSRTSFRT